MTDPATLSVRDPLDAYMRAADRLLDALRARDDAAAWRIRWAHPRFRDRPVADVREAALDVDDARIVVAREHAFDTWDELATFTDRVAHGGVVARFEQAAEWVIDGDLPSLDAALREDPMLVRARSVRTHHATLLHYVAANGVEGARQRTPRNVLAIAGALLDAGADANALAEMYGGRCTTLDLLVSSTPPHEAGVQTALAELLVSRGAAIEHEGSRWSSALLTALTFGFGGTARALAARARPTTDLAVAAGLGALGDCARLLPTADEASRQGALALAAMHGHARVVRLLLDTGTDPDRFNPDGIHAHSTPLHQAVSSDRLDVVRLLVERGARLDVRDLLYDGTPLDWALHEHRAEIAAYLREAMDAGVASAG
jgi:ankyrin repeat protein